MKDLQKECAKFRKSIGYTQQQVADELGYTVMNISMFENGRNNNMSILLWYVEHGFDIKGGEDNDNN